MDGKRKALVGIVVVVALVLVMLAVGFKKIPRGGLTPTPPLPGAEAPAASSAQPTALTRIPAECVEVKAADLYHPSFHPEEQQVNKRTKVYESLDAARAVSALKVCQLRLFEKGLAEVPPEVWKFTNLVELNLAGNKLTSLPSQIGTLKNLQVLYLGSNQMKTLPPEIGSLPNLALLSLYANQLERIPQEVQNLKSLRKLGLTGNPLSQEEKAKIAQWLPGVTIDF